MSISYHEYLESPEWKARARMKRKEAGMRCQLCNERGELHVHHRNYEAIGDEHPSDLVVLCSTCHNKFHNEIRSPELSEDYIRGRQDGYNEGQEVALAYISLFIVYKRRTSYKFIKSFTSLFSSSEKQQKRKYKRFFQLIKALPNSQIEEALNHFYPPAAEIGGSK